MLRLMHGCGTHYHYNAIAQSPGYDSELLMHMHGWLDRYKLWDKHWWLHPQPLSKWRKLQCEWSTHSWSSLWLLLASYTDHVGGSTLSCGRSTGLASLPMHKLLNCSMKALCMQLISQSICTWHFPGSGECLLLYVCARLHGRHMSDQHQWLWPLPLRE